jgi:uncharacterized membrane protein YuzA (DUF378 family)
MFAQSILDDDPSRATKIERVQFRGWTVYCLANMALAVPLLVLRWRHSDNIRSHVVCTNINDPLVGHFFGFLWLFQLVGNRASLGRLVLLLVGILNFGVYLLSAYTAYMLHQNWTACAIAMSSPLLCYVAMAMLFVVWFIQLPTFILWCLLYRQGYALSAPDV